MRAARLLVASAFAILIATASHAVNATVTVPDSGSGSCTDCFTITNTNASGSTAILGVGNSGTVGVKGTSVDNAGVHGDSTNFAGVVGTAHGANTAGVYGTGDYGVYGLGSAIGVRGQSSNGTGMEATSTNGDGIHATTSNSSHSGLWVENLASGGGGWGVFATAGGTGHAVHGANSNSSGWAGYFDGKVYASAGYTSSDARLKKDVADMSYGLKDIAALRAVTFKWKDQARGDGRQLGFIAQELQKVMPELVDKDSSTGMLAVNYPALVPVLVKVIQDQEKRIAALEGRTPMMSSLVSLDGIGGLAIALLPVGVVVAIRRRRKQPV